MVGRRGSFLLGPTAFFQERKCSLSQWTLKKKSLNGFFSPLNICSPKKLRKFSHWPSKNVSFREGSSVPKSIKVDLHFLAPCQRLNDCEGHQNLYGLIKVLRYTWETLCRHLKFWGPFFLGGGLEPYEKTVHFGCSNVLRRPNLGLHR